MGISKKLIKPRHISPIIILLGCLILSGSVKAQNVLNDPITKVNGVKCYMHTVVKEETIYGIAQKFNVQPRDIILANPSAIDGVKAGDVLVIPVAGASKPGDTSKARGNYVYHDVLPKETLYSLAKKYNTTISAIDSLNPEIADKGLKKGQRIRIPLGQIVTPETNKIEGKHALHKDTLTKPAVVTGGQIKDNLNETNAFKNLVIEQTHADTSKVLKVIQDTGRKLDRYNIALIMPFANEGSDTLRLSRLLDGTMQIPQTTMVSVDFYHGVLIALDSLAKKGFKANLRVFNSLPGSDSSGYVIDSILKNPAMLKMNLIIGPPYPSNFKKVTWYADMHHIPIVSPLSSENSVLKFTSFASKIVPSAMTEMEFEADYIASHYSHANIIVIHNRDANDEFYEVFRKRYYIKDSSLGNKDTLRHAESIGGVSGLKAKINKNAVNVIVMPYQGAPFVAKFVNELANSNMSYDDSLVLFGMHNWATNDALAAENLDTLNFHFPSNEFIDYSDLPTKKFIARHRNTYLSEPSYYSYEGYDAAMFYGTLLQTYGTDIQNHLSDVKYRGLQTSFNMFRSDSTTGYENIAVYMLEYENYTEKLDLR